MICKPDSRILSLLAAGLLFALSACSEPPDTRSPLERAQSALQAGDAMGAELILEELLRSGTPREDVAAYLGQAELSQGKLTEARRWLETGEFSQESAGLGFFMLGRLEFEEGNLSAAGAAYDRAYAVNPDDPELWVDIARLRYRGGEQLQAIDASVKAVELGPDNPAALLMRAQLVREAYGATFALPLFRQAIEADPKNLDLKADYAATLGDAGHAAEMLAILREIHKADPHDARPYFMQSVLAARAGNYELARSLLLRAGVSSEESALSELVEGIVDLENENVDSAAQSFGNLLQEQPDNRRVRHLFARALYLGGNYRELIYRFGEAARLPSAAPYLQTLVGRAHEAMGERAAAAAYLDRSAMPRKINLVAVQSDIPLDVAELGDRQQGANAVALVRGNIVAGRTGAAIADAETFKARFPGSGDAFALAGDARLAARQPGKANDYYRAAARIRRPWPLTRRMYAALVAIGREDQALQLVEQHLRVEPANSEAATMLAYAASSRQDWLAAARYADVALANGGARNPDLHVLRARIAQQLGDTERAQSSAAMAAILQPANGAVVEASDISPEQAWGIRNRMRQLRLAK